MKLRQLQCLCAVVDSGFNISRAAVVLHATQPAISKQLRQFEEELGMDLLVRQLGRPVALTEGGERTLVWARRAMQCSQNIRAIAKDRGGDTGGNFALATSHTHASYVLLPAVVEFNRRFPKVRITVLQGAPAQVAELVREGTAAVGISHQPWDLTKEIVVEPFMSSSRVLVAQPGHPLLKEKELTLEKIAAYPLVIPHSARPQGARIVNKFQEAGLEVNVAVLALDSDVVKSFVASGIGIGIVPAFCFSAQKDRNLRGRDVGHLFEPAVSTVLLKRDSHLPQYVYQFLEVLDPALETRKLQTMVLGEV